MTDPIVETDCGKIRGSVQPGGSLAFKGIPYAAPTGGPQRFMPPRKREPWTNVRDCQEWGPLAPQGGGSAAIAAGLGGGVFAQLFGLHDVARVMSEDCLVLNVFTPALDASRRPVLVWLHGGGFSIGGGSGSRNDGTHLAERRDVVVVTLNHRIGVLGYCHLGELDPDFAHSGNVGQLDLIAALEWVRDNIERFGGDPGRVMIHGESGGGSKVSTLLAMPSARGLFHRAVSQSGMGNRLSDVEQATETAGRLLEELGLSPSDLRKLQDLPLETLLAAAAKVDGGMLAGHRGFAPTVGTLDLAVQPLEAIASGSAARIPLVVGCTKHESALWVAGSLANGALTDEQLETRMGAVFGVKATELLDGYRTHHPDYGPADLWIRILSDGARLSAIELAEAHVEGGGSPTYMYLFTWESPVVPQLRAAHGIDGTFYVDNTETVDMAKGNPEARTLATRASGAWTRFAHDGVPAAAGLPEWPPYTFERRETMILCAAPHIERDPMREDRVLRQRLRG